MENTPKKLEKHVLEAFQKKLMDELVDVVCNNTDAFFEENFTAEDEVTITEYARSAESSIYAIADVLMKTIASLVVLTGDTDVVDTYFGVFRRYLDSMLEDEGEIRKELESTIADSLNTLH